ncbi:hypothetical protein ACQ4M4_22045 [Leptolyngbya sp. AN02str]|uniref:hypothetical protein n=1 Tax=Leptolyngbya sp. AN02str TaxID=3423363 RepID=UPI003D314F7E
MTSMTLAHRNGASANLPSPSWLQQSTRKFFGEFNWEDIPPNVQEIRVTAVEVPNEPLSLLLTTSQFFGAMNWEGDAIAQTTPLPPADQVDAVDVFTLEDFSDLF